MSDNLRRENLFCGEPNDEEKTLDENGKQVVLKTLVENDKQVVNSSFAACSVFFYGDDNVLILCRTENDTPDMCVNEEKATIETRNSICKIKRFLLLFLYKPVKLSIIDEWKKKIYELNEYADLRIDFLRMGGFTQEYLEGRIAKHCVGWRLPPPQQVNSFPEFEVGSLIEIDEKGKDKSDPAFLSVMFGKTGALLQRLHLVANLFKDIKRGKLTTALGLGCNGDIGAVDTELRKIREAADALLECKEALDKPNERERGEKDARDFIEKTSSCHVSEFPKILLCGESGVGKTLLAKYIQNVIAKNVSISRIAIPEYLNKEEYFEYSLFGYKKGAYTDADFGSHGLLMESIGNVVFLDEIGEASPTIQAKLLTYLDDYCFLPRGWVGKPFYCPVFIIAATNRNLKAMAEEGRFRKDLLARFTDIEFIPPLRERLESVDFIIDILMQRDDINPINDAQNPDNGRWIDVLEPEALLKLRYQDYHEGNFRELEEVLRRACRIAHRDGRTRMRAHDVQPL